jgi:hypothetical protein
MIRQKEMRNVLIALLGGVWAITASVAFAAEAQAPTQVAVINIVEGPGPFAPFFDRYTAIYKKYGLNVERELWYQGFAGPESGRWVVVVKYADMQEFSKSGTVVDSPEYQALGTEFQQKGFRVESTSLQFRVR